MHKRKWLGIILLLCLLFTGCTAEEIAGEVPQGTEEIESESIKAEYGEAKGANASSSGTVSGEGIEVHYIDVGQGDATLIKCGSHAMLIDGGNNHLGTTVQLYLKNQGVESLDYIIGTHPDADHIGGLDVIAYKFDFDTIIMPDYEKDTKTYQELMDVIADKNKKVTYPVPGTSYSLGEAVFTILAPISNDYGTNANNYSVALMLEYKETRFLFTGDAEEESEAEMLQSGRELFADVYKAAHHGSSSASTEAFLEAVHPSYAVISCGEDNSYGHPHAEVLNRLRQNGIQVFRTDEQGSIVASSDGKEIKWNCASDISWKAGERRESDSEVEAAEEQKAAVTEEGNTYILNTNTKKFHLPECKSVAQIKAKNCQESEQSRTEIMNMGYEPCQNCNP